MKLLKLGAEESDSNAHLHPHPHPHPYPHLIRSILILFLTRHPINTFPRVSIRFLYTCIIIFKSQQRERHQTQFKENHITPTCPRIGRFGVGVKWVWRYRSSNTRSDTGISTKQKTFDHLVWRSLLESGFEKGHLLLSPILVTIHQTSRLSSWKTLHVHYIILWYRNNYHCWWVDISEALLPVLIKPIGKQLMPM